MRIATTLIMAVGLALGGCSSDDDTNGNGGGVAGAGGAEPTGPSEGTVARYEYALDFTSRAATSELTIDITQGGDCHSKSCQIWPATVGLNGEPAASFDVADGSLTACGPSVSQGDTLTMAADVVLMENTYLGLDVGFSRKQNMAGGTFSYLLSWVGGCDYFGPCDDRPGTLAEFHFDLTHDQGTTALCPGVLTPGAASTQCELSGTLAPTYSAFFAAHDADWVREPFVIAAGIEVVFFEVPGGGLADALDAQAVTAYLNWITALLGPYPYGSELRVAGAPTAWLGFEHPANIILLDRLPTISTAMADGTMHVFMHEVVHQWAGDRTTLADIADFVWKEATAEYLTYVFEDEYSPAGHADATRHYWHQISPGATYHPRPTDDPTPPVEEFYGDVYGAGPMVVYLQLESMLGRATVLAAIASFLSEPGVRSVADLRGELEAASGEDLSAYFDAWVFGSGPPTWPSLTVATDQQGDQVTVTVTQQGPELFGCLVEVDVHGANSSVTALVDFGLAPTSASAQGTVTLSEAVVSTDLDPRERLIEQTANATAQKPKVWIF